MQTNGNVFRNQRGGSTLIGLVLGLCLGMLALIKWPQLETPIRALLAEHDLELAVAGASDSVQRSTLPVSRGSVLDEAKRATPTNTPTNNSDQLDGSALETAYSISNNATAALPVSEPKVAGLRAPTSSTDITSPDMAFVDTQQAPGRVAGVAKADVVRGTHGVQMTTDVPASSLSAQPGAIERDPTSYETREVWQAFSSESAAEAFATVVSNALNIEVQTLRQSDHKVVPIVRCDGLSECNAMRAEITALLAGSSESEVYDEI